MQEIEYYKQLLKNDFIMPKIEPNGSGNLFQQADDDTILEIDKITHTNSFQYKKTSKKNKKIRYNIPNATIKRHSHIGQ